MKRSIVVMLAAISALLAVECAVLWVRSYSVGDHMRRYVQPSDFNVMSCGGLICVSFGELVSEKYAPPAGWDVEFWPFHRSDLYFEADFWRDTTLGFRYDRWRSSSPGNTSNGRSLIVPHWFPLVLFSGLPAVTVYRWRNSRARARRAAQHRCAICGYDLRATPERCPECGSAAELARSGSDA